jgi:uncharacterized protein (DUF1330 family)
VQSSFRPGFLASYKQTKNLHHRWAQMTISVARPIRGHQPQGVSKMRIKMRNSFKIAIAAIAGAVIGAAAVQGLHAQAKPKAYQVAEFEGVGDISPTYLSTVRAAMEQAHGRSLRTLKGRIIPIEGAGPPANAALLEFDSVDAALAFYKSKAWTDGEPERARSEKLIRRYLVEAEN